LKLSANFESKPESPERFRLPAAVLAVPLFFAPLAAAGQQVPLPPVDLGATSFVDGVGGPGLFVQDIIEPFHASRFQSPAGQTLPGNNSVDTFASITELAYTTRLRLLGANIGGEFLVPIAHVDVDTDLGVRGTQGGVGDVIVSPFLLQWPAHKLFGKTFFERLHVVELILPTGRYSRTAAVNIGNNVVSVNPMYAFTLFLTPKLETSWRLHYLWNSSNNDPNPVYNATSIQPGQAVHFNASTSYQFGSRLRIGAAGYYLKGVTDPKIGDKSIRDSREQIGAIGPGLWVQTGPLEIYMHAFFEMGAENRPQGSRYVIRFVRIFPAKPKGQ
jgi:hypothetical protein